MTYITGSKGKPRLTRVFFYPFLWIDFFFHCHHQTLDWLKIGLSKKNSNLLSIALSRSHYKWCGFIQFIQVDSSHLFLNEFFILFYPPTLIVCKLSFMKFFFNYLLHMGLSWPHNPCREFYCLTNVGSSQSDMLPS
jgi:hypothetical protein